MRNAMLPPLNWLRSFDASARHLSFTGAAQELGITQSAISQQIKSLEAFLGQQLFFRKTRVLELTEAGRQYLPTVQDAFVTLTAGTRAVIGPDREQALHVQSNLAFSVFWLAPRLKRLFAQHPWLQINITTAIWEPERTAAAADVEIRFGPPPEETIQAERLSWDQCYPVCAPDYAASTIPFSDHRLFDCAGLQTTWDVWTTAQQMSPPARNVVTYASTFSVSLAAATAGAGLALGHDTLVDHQLRQGLLVRPYDFSIPMRESYYLIARRAPDASAAVRAFVEWVHSEMAGGGAPPV